MDSVAHLNSALAGRYAIDREIGAGGMATVYLARDVRHERRVALKYRHAADRADGRLHLESVAPQLRCVAR